MYVVLVVQLMQKTIPESKPASPTSDASVSTPRCSLRATNKVGYADRLVGRNELFIPEKIKLLTFRCKVALKVLAAHGEMQRLEVGSDGRPAFRAGTKRSKMFGCTLGVYGSETRSVYVTLDRMASVR